MVVSIPGYIVFSTLSCPLYRHVWSVTVLLFSYNSGPVVTSEMFLEELEKDICCLFVIDLNSLLMLYENHNAIV